MLLLLWMKKLKLTLRASALGSGARGAAPPRLLESVWSGRADLPSASQPPDSRGGLICRHRDVVTKEENNSVTRARDVGSGSGLRTHRVTLVLVVIGGVGGRHRGNQLVTGVTGTLLRHRDPGSVCDPSFRCPVCRRISVCKSEAASRKAGTMKPVFGEVFGLLAPREHELGAETPPPSPHILPAEDVAARGLYLGHRSPHGLHGWGRGPSPLRCALSRDVGPSWVPGLPLWVRTGQETPHPHPQGLGCIPA